MTSITVERLESLCRATNGKPEWYPTRRKVTAEERRLGLRWDGGAKRHMPGCQGRLVQSRNGTWARERDGVASALTAEECAALKLAAGPGNQ